VYVFVSAGRFPSIEALHNFLDPTYTEDGDLLPSPFMSEVEQSEYEPMCVERILVDDPVTVSRLLADASYASYWLPHIDNTYQGNMALCIFSPNRLEHPERSSLTYLGTVTFSIGG
jgi:hypothetical protein